MPATDAALEAARAAADVYVNTLTARRRVHETLPLDDPGRADALGCLGDATRRALLAFLVSLDDLNAQGGTAEAMTLIHAVDERTTAARPPVEVSVSEESR